MPDQEPRRPGRRLFLAGAGAVVLAPLSGCGIRLEDDAPRVPFVPARTPVPAEDLLTALTRDCARLADLAAAAGGPLAAELSSLHARQHTVLRTTLLRRGVPAAALDPSADPTRSPTPSPDASTGDTGAPLAAAEAAAASGAARFAGVDAALRGPVAAVHAQRFAAATLLTGSAPPVPDGSVTGATVDDLTTATDAAVYLTEVGTARSGGARRARGTTTLAALRALRADLASGGDAPPPVLGVPLPFPVRTGAEVDRLVTETLTTLRATVGASLAPLLADDTADGLSAVTRWLGAVEVEAHRWGLPLAPFPGLT